MGKHAPLAVKAATAAALLDMPPKEFHRLVALGALPPPKIIGGHERWHVAQIEAIIRGDAAKPDGEFEL